MKKTTAKTLRRQGLKELRKLTDAMLKKWVDRGGDLTQWVCPNCKRPNTTRRPSRVDVGPRGQWDSMTTCLHCGLISMVVTSPDGARVIDIDDVEY